MALSLNLLHEEISEQRQRQRDPLKLGMMALGFIGALMALFYMWKAYQTLEIKSRLAAVQADWAKVEPDVTAAQKRSTELTKMMSTTKVLDQIVEGRFYWAPLLQNLSRCVAPNAQLTSIDGTISEDAKTVTLALEGIAAGREPRSAAEELRQLLSEQLGQSYSAVKVEFKTLEDLDTIVNVAGTNMEMARYIISASFSPTTPEAAKAAAAAATRAPKQ
jgi:Tfp pilus assembly protein PilN